MRPFAKKPSSIAVPILVRRNLRAIQTQEFLGPIMEVERIELISYVTGRKDLVEYERFHLENGQSFKAEDLWFVEVDEELLVALRLESQILAKENAFKKNR